MIRRNVLSDKVSQRNREAREIHWLLGCDASPLILETLLQTSPSPLVEMEIAKETNQDC